MVNKKTNNKSWFKKKSSIIAMSSTLGVGLIATAVAVPLTLMSANYGTHETIVINSIISLYDKTTKDVKLVIEGLNLPDKSDSYSITNLPNVKNNTPSPYKSITLVVEVPKTQIILSFNDPTLTIDSTYKVVVNSSGDSVVYNTSKGSPLPSITITQPNDVTLFKDAQSFLTTLTADVVVNNPINGIQPSFQWFSSNTIDSGWMPIDGATDKNYLYNATNSKKYFKCIVSYKYIQQVSFNPIFVQVVDYPTISITKEPESVVISQGQGEREVLFSVNAKTDILLPNESLSYQWFADNERESGITWIKQANGSSSSFTYNSSFVDANNKKHFKCEISYKLAKTVTTNIVYIEKAIPPTISFVSTPSNLTIPFSQDTADLSVDVRIDNPVASETLNYIWMISDSPQSNWTPIENSNSSTYTYNVNSPNFPLASGSKKYFKCIVSYSGANNSVPLESPPIYIQRLAQ